LTHVGRSKSPLAGYYFAAALTHNGTSPAAVGVAAKLSRPQGKTLLTRGFVKLDASPGYTRRAKVFGMSLFSDNTPRPVPDLFAEPAESVGQRDLHGELTGVEVDQPDDIKIAVPFDPEAIDVVTRNVTVDLLLSRAESEMINLQPDFQRRWGVWDVRRQSRLIESLLLRIPLPVLYAAEDENEKWEIVDGIQRLSTIARFMRPNVVGTDKLTLSGLEYLEDYNGKTFEELSARLQLRLRETELVVHLIRKGTPAEVKFNVFARINTGGIALSPQELRHAITPGPARRILEDWAALPAFERATDGSIRPTRMDDRELVLRFLAFFLLGLDAYKQADMDGFLIRAMKSLNNLPGTELNDAHIAFDRAMEAAHAIFGNDAFRKRYHPDAARLPINKALFEAVSVNLAQADQHNLSRLVERKREVLDGFMALCSDRSFEAAISQGTGDINKVNRRFKSLAELFAGVVKNA